MLSVTDEALELLAGVVERAQGQEGAAVRIVARPQGWAMEIDQPRPEDETFQLEDRTVLVLEAGVAERLQDTTLDVHDTPEGRKLQLR